MATDFTISDVLAWARTKPADERYDYENPRNCALCQFLRETGRCDAPAVSSGYGWGEASAPMRSRRQYPSELESPLSRSDTFGGLVKRLEAICPDTVVTPSEWPKLDAYLTEQVSA